MILSQRRNVVQR